MSIVEFLLARIAEDEAVALAAVDPDRPGRHWQWVRTADDVVMPTTADDIAEALDEGWSISLRTVEEFPTSSGVGPLPGFLIDHVDEGAPLALVHIVRWDPTRVLAECEAKRQLIEEIQGMENRIESEWGGGSGYGARFTPDMMLGLRVMAAVYSDHPDFDPAWSPDA